VGIIARVSGLRYLRFSSVAAGLLFPAFLLVPGPGLKLAAVAVLGVAKAGWYAILKGRLYAALPDRRGTARAIGDAGGMAGSLLPLGVGLIARAVGLGPAFWTMLLAPLALLVLVPADDAAPRRTS
ncbi:MAG TPA: MFS transporter, partial [Candidatus Dormibacteraeota bacterium]|nr:MFS transporter [Candidatus Dormibacteraeota bacterium]